MALQRQISLALNQKKIGRTFEVLIEEVNDEEHTCIGRTCYDAREIDNEVLFTSAVTHKIGDFATVSITDAFDYDLTGKEIVQ